MPGTENLSPEDRLREVAAILAKGILRLPPEHAAPKETSDSGRISLAFRAPLRLDSDAG